MLVIGLLVIAVISVLLLFGNGLLSSGSDWRVTDEGILQYSVSMPEYQQKFIEDANDSTLYAVSFASKDQQMDALLRIPWTNGSEAKRGDADGKKKGNNLPGIVLLPGATVTKEREQGLARYLSSLGFASITIRPAKPGRHESAGRLADVLAGR